MNEAEVKRLICEATGASEEQVEMVLGITNAIGTELYGPDGDWFGEE